MSYVKGNRMMKHKQLIKINEIFEKPKEKI